MGVREKLQRSSLILDGFHINANKLTTYKKWSTAYNVKLHEITAATWAWWLSSTLHAIKDCVWNDQFCKVGWFEFSAKILWVNCQWSGKQGQNATETFERWAGHGRQPRNRDVNVKAIRVRFLSFHLDIPDDLGQVTYQLRATFPVCKVGIIIPAVSLSGMPASRSTLQSPGAAARKSSSHYQARWPWFTLPHNPDPKF